ncbi:FecCD transport family protein [Streptomyces sp. yr375]|nr:FecCD transport family protein [Streptomyces sp. yr375]
MPSEPSARCRTSRTRETLRKRSRSRPAPLSRSAVGPLVFVGLAVPHMARLITGADRRWTLPLSMLLAPSLLLLLLLLADVLGRVVVRPDELDAGVVTAVVGAPMFIALVRQRRVVAV